MIKNITPRSRLIILRNLIYHNIVFKVILLILNPILLINKIKNYKKDKYKVSKINWGLRTDQLGKHGVISSDTPPEDFDYVTKLQKKILFSNLKRFVSKKEKKILDYGCGSGRFTGALAKISYKANVLGVDPEKKLIDLAKPKKNVKYIVLKNLNQIKSKFDIIFISNVLGGIEIKNLYKLNKSLISKLKKNGILFLSEHISNKKNIESEVLKGWAFRSDDFYLNLFKKINLRKVDEYSYNGYRTSIYVGKRKEKVLKNLKKPLKYRK
tara:strand:+ start:63 stop:866 length:804 start_codon:yes stop_codon:yes gene_type:complete